MGLSADEVQLRMELQLCSNYILYINIILQLAIILFTSLMLVCIPTVQVVSIKEVKGRMASYIRATSLLHTG